MRTCSKLNSIVSRTLMCVLLASSSSFAHGAAPAAHDTGAWRKHQYSFTFMGFTSTYSCDGLADKLKTLLIAAGARPDAKALAGPCSQGFGRPDKFARADLTFYTLPPPGSDKTEGQPVEGSWMPVAIGDRRPREIALGDCELVEQFKSSVLPMFTTRNVGYRTTCVPHQESGSFIDLRFETFTVPAKDKHPQQAATGP